MRSTCRFSLRCWTIDYVQHHRCSPVLRMLSTMKWRNQKRELRARLDTDEGRAFACKAISAVITAQITVLRSLDWGRVPNPPVPENSLTAVIKTFERPRELRRLVSSIRRTQPSLPVMIVDDGRSPQPIDGAELLAMPFNSGISRGRNAALDRIHTPYFLLLDDDFVFYRHTRVAEALAVIDAYPSIDILGGRVVNLPDFTTHDYSLLVARSLGPTPEYPPGSFIGQLPVYAKVPNFFIGRTEAVGSLGWLDELKVMEHQEFFDRAFGRLTTVYDDRFRVLHARNPFDRSSPERRQNQIDATVALQRLQRDAARPDNR